MEVKLQIHLCRGSENSKRVVRKEYILPHCSCCFPRRGPRLTCLLADLDGANPRAFWMFCLYKNNKIITSATSYRLIKEFVSTVLAWAIKSQYPPKISTDTGKKILTMRRRWLTDGRWPGLPDRHGAENVEENKTAVRHVITQQVSVAQALTKYIHIN
jgi:hypothetical protein